MTARLVRSIKRLARRIVGRPILGRSILIYHRIAAADFDPWNIAVAPSEFERQLNSLRRKNVLPLREFRRLHNDGKLPRNAVAITFDDGYADNALVAAPMLNSFGYPATFFIVSGAILHPEEFWWDQLVAIYSAHRFDFQAALSLLESRTAKKIDEETQDEGPFADFLLMWTMLRRLSREERQQSLDALRDQVGMEKRTRPTHRPMTEAELRTLAANPLFEIGAHTITHPCLPFLSAVEQEREIVWSIRSLEAILGKPVRSFSYPFGAYAPLTQDIVERTGLECAVITEHRRVRAGDSQFALPRRQVVNRYAITP